MRWISVKENNRLPPCTFGRITYCYS